MLMSRGRDELNRKCLGEGQLPPKNDTDDSKCSPYASACSDITKMTCYRGVLKAEVWSMQNACT